ncbi:MAG: ribosomal-protein-alanine N-acetyltransferase [Rhodobacteraceae bacterium]|nr:ribosomal-protein-alanine N-acetyltransferase [Paracoccaceae bacterium]
MTPEDMAKIHAACFTSPAPWGAAAIAASIAAKGGFAITPPDGGTAGFALGRVILDEAELLTIAVLPDARRQGLGRALIAAFADRARAMGAAFAFLEVAAGNTAAITLYTAVGFSKSGLRPGYYHHPDGSSEDALLMSMPLDAPNF